MSVCLTRSAAGCADGRCPYPVAAAAAGGGGLRSRCHPPEHRRLPGCRPRPSPPCHATSSPLATPALTHAYYVSDTAVLHT